MRKKIVIGAFVVLSLVFCVSAYNVIKIVWENWQEKKTYRNLQTQYVTILPTQTQTEELPEPPEPEVQTSRIVVDFEALKEINKEVVGWLYCEDTYIHYPVVQAKDNNKYLRRDLEGKYLVSGTLFVDFRNRPIGQDKNYIIYGHNRKTDQMFGTLVKYKNRLTMKPIPPCFIRRRGGITFWRRLQGGSWTKRRSSMILIRIRRFIRPFWKAPCKIPPLIPVFPLRRRINSSFCPLALRKKPPPGMYCFASIPL